MPSYRLSQTCSFADLVEDPCRTHHFRYAGFYQSSVNIVGEPLQLRRRRHDMAIALVVRGELGDCFFASGILNKFTLELWCAQIFT